MSNFLQNVKKSINKKNAESLFSGGSESLNEMPKAILGIRYSHKSEHSTKNVYGGMPKQ